MAQITSGLRAILSSPAIYDAFQNIMGADRIRRELVANYIRPAVGMRILDIGCGTARILDYLPDVDYHGFDLSQRYIDEAQRRCGDRGHFRCALVEQATLDDMPPFDIVLAVGVLHHLDDNSALSLLNLAKCALRPGGRLVTIDPCYDLAQNPVARFLVSRDRGQNVRSGGAYRELAYNVFAHVQGEVRHRAWIPYTHWVMECTK